VPTAVTFHAVALAARIDEDFWGFVAVGIDVKLP
jgi:hypothetical protein